MKIVYLSSEVVPFAKTGGLADISGIIPKSLQELGIEIIVVMPFYDIVKNSQYPIKKTDIQFSVKIGDSLMSGYVYKGYLPGTQVPIYFLENQQYFDRAGLYNYPGTLKSYEDNGERFIFFSRGILEVIEKLKFSPDIVHCNDWQTGLVPVYLKTLYADKECFKNTKTVITIHNLAYQGVFSPREMNLAGLDWSLFNWKQLEFYGKINFLKGGIVFSDLITTVSKTYAKEIQTPEYGCGLENILKERSKYIFGIVNGIDYSIWNPETDKYIFANYGIKELKGKQLCKGALQKRYKLPEKNVPVIGMITRLTEQKGLDLIVNKFYNLISNDLQLILLGTGDQYYQELFRKCAKDFPTKIAVNLTFDERSAHEIEAGADMFLMPSRFEPCGLNQLYSLKYGTIPIVRKTGGLADTITDVRYGIINNGNVNGFSFTAYNADLLYATIIKAIDFYKNKFLWTKLMKNGMTQIWSWERSAKEYDALYKNIV